MDQGDRSVTGCRRHAPGFPDGNCEPPRTARAKGIRARVSADPGAGAGRRHRQPTGQGKVAAETGEWIGAPGADTLWTGADQPTMRPSSSSALPSIVTSAPFSTSHAPNGEAFLPERNV